MASIAQPSWFSRYRYDLYCCICEMNGLTLDKARPRWAHVLYAILFPWVYLRYQLLMVRGPETNTYVVNGQRFTWEFLDAISRGTPEDLWFRTSLDRGQLEVHITRGGVLQNIVERQKAWSEHMFGTGARTEGLLKHVLKEVEEVRANPTDVEEWIDLMILAMDGAWRSGSTPEQVVRALQAKMEKNRGRVWPTGMGETDAIEHAR